MMDEVALAATIGGSAVALGGIAFGWLNSRGERGHAANLAHQQHEHDRRMARSERFFDARAEAYQGLLRELRNAALIVERTHPIIGPKPPPPEPTSDEEWEDMYIKVAIYGSPELIKAFETFARNVRAFQAHVFTHEHMKDHPSGVDTWKPMQDAREEVNIALRDLERQMREELAEL